MVTKTLHGVKVPIRDDRSARSQSSEDGEGVHTLVLIGGRVGRVSGGRLVTEWRVNKEISELEMNVV